MIRQLNLGSGSHLLPGYVNVDVLPVADVQADLDKRWPWPDGSIDRILMRHSLEHLNLEHCYLEAARVLRSGGEWDVWVPHGLSPLSKGLGHTKDYSLLTFEHISKGMEYWLPAHFDTVTLTLEFSCIRRCWRWLRWPANIAPWHWEACGCLPLAEIHWVGKRI